VGSERSPSVEGASAINRRQQLRELYGFDFPEDFFRFWEFAMRLRPLEPLAALAETTGAYLVGPFAVLAGRFDRRTTRYNQLLHWRYYLDPPEFFTVLAGGGDSLHWGYYLDDPVRLPGSVASYFAADVFELTDDGDTLFEAIRLSLEGHYRSCAEHREDDREHARQYEAKMRELDTLRNAVLRNGTAERQEVGDEYVETYQACSSRQGRVVAATYEGMGIVVPPKQYRPMSVKDRRLWARLRKDDNPRDLVDEARQALRAGFAGTALKLGKDLWAAGGEHQTMYSYELLDAAYDVLGRDSLRRVLREHRAHRELPTVDILAAEAQKDGGCN
jgi:Histone PARylation factor 1